jgi:hypothetical protein
MMRSQSQKSAARCRKPRMSPLVACVAEQVESPERMFELYYWSLEPELLDTIRAIAALPPESRAALDTFLAIAGDPQSVAATVDGNGNLTLASPHIAEALAEVIDTRETCIEITPSLAQRIH